MGNYYIDMIAKLRVVNDNICTFAKNVETQNEQIIQLLQCQKDMLQKMLDHYKLMEIRDEFKQSGL